MIYGGLVLQPFKVGVKDLIDRARGDGEDPAGEGRW